MSQYVLALDQGTTSSRAIVFDESARAVGMAQQEFEQIFPAPGHVEHDAEAIWDSQIATARAALIDAEIEASDLAALGIANQRETTVVWDRETGQPVANAIVWQSRVTAERCAALKQAGYESVVRDKTGWCWTRISREPRSPTCWTKSRGFGRVLNAARFCSARLIRSWPGV